MKAVVNRQRKIVIANFFLTFLGSSLATILIASVVADLGGKLDFLSIILLIGYTIQSMMFFYPIMSAASETILLVTIKGSALLFQTWNENMKSDLRKIKEMSPKFQGKS